MNFNEWVKRSEILFPLFFVCIIVMLVVPLPTFILDLLLSLNISLSMVVLLTTIYTPRAIDFSIFPALLLVTTVFRLALNVSSTRLILLQGIAFGGKIIRAFGEFVIGGNYVVGIVIFLILVIIQFIVIIRGATRVSEVAARFTLDAMPGKQLAIDADLQQGLITEAEAKERRKEIRQEADFYGAMDGAAKFVQGDTMAGLIITFINIIGGLIIGTIFRGEPIMEAARVYTTLTVGDGLVAQIPSLLVSVATGLIVTRAATDSEMSTDVVRQLTRQPRALYIASGILTFFGIFTPLPASSLLPMAAFFAFIAYQSHQSMQVLAKEKEATKKKKEAEEIKKPENVTALLTVDPMELEIGYSLIPLVDPQRGGDLLDRITLIRRQMALEMGIIVPPIRIRDNLKLKPEAYIIKIRGVEVAGGTLRIDRYLAMNPGTVDVKIPGEVTVEPAFGFPAIWVSEENREKAEMAGYTVVDVPTVIATHLTEVIRNNAHIILGRKEVKDILDNLKRTNEALVNELIPNVLTMGEVHKVLQRLLEEDVSIRDMITILETLSDKAVAYGKDIELLVEATRQALARHICKSLQQPDGKMYLVTLDPALENIIVNSIQETPEGKIAAIEPTINQKLLRNIATEVDKLTKKGYPAVVLCSPAIRNVFRKLTRKVAPGLKVISFQEITSDIDIQAVGMVGV
ncbi:MAG: flagellar biosynthesis protein FlhA [Candidatus Hydrogenedentota bacterium]